MPTPRAPASPVPVDRLFRDGGEMGARIRAYDWAATPLGPPETWPAHLRTCVGLLLASRQPMLLGWPHDLISLYNDAYRLLLGTDKHPGALGARLADTFAGDAYQQLRPVYEALLQRGEAVAFEGAAVPLTRYGYFEEVFFDFSYTPVYGEGDGVDGMFVACTEATERVLSARRTQTLAALAAQVVGAQDAGEVAGAVMAALGDHPHDVPFARLYLPGPGETGWHLAAQTGLNGDQPGAWLLEDVARTGQPHFARDLSFSAGPWPEPVTEVATLPLRHSNRTSMLGVLVVGLSARKRLDDAYRHFLSLLAGQVTSALESAATTATLHAQRDELAARTRALEGFAELTRDLTLHDDPHALIRRTQEVVLSLLPPGFSGYYEPEGGWWRLKSQVGQASTPGLQAVLDAGLSFEATTNLLIPWRSGEPLYQDEYDPDLDHLTGNDESPGASVTIPIAVGGQTRGILSFALYTVRRWSGEDRAVLETVGHQLTLALERAEQTQRVAVQNAELDARNRALTAFEEWSRDLTVDAEPYALIRRAQELLHTLLPVDAALYYERAGDHWYVRSMRGEFGSDSLRQAHEAGLPHDTTDDLRLPFETGEPYYQDVYDTDHLEGHMAHVSATAMLPLWTLRGVRGIFGLVRFGQPGWSNIERTTFETVRRSLELALDRADQVTELARERAALRARTAELADTNEELEAFTYSVSHDLRTPVRHVIGFNQLLRQQLGEGLDAKTTRYLQVVDEAAGRMNTLIDAMLDLSRTSRLPLRLRPVDLGDLVGSVRLELELDVLDREVAWHVQPLPLVSGDHDTLRQVMLNLLDNALKYTRTRKVARIEVGAEERPGEWVIAVRDNGVGFDSRYSDKLFGVFQRLHRAEEFEGTGVGLANVRRIIARHGGRVSAESQLGEGATFSFTLPRS